MATEADSKPPTLFDRIVRWGKNNPVITLALVATAVVTGAAKAKDAVATLFPSPTIEVRAINLAGSSDLIYQDETGPECGAGPPIRTFAPHPANGNTTKPLYLQFTLVSRSDVQIAVDTVVFYVERADQTRGGGLAIPNTEAEPVVLPHAMGIHEHRLKFPHYIEPGTVYAVEFMLRGEPPEVGLCYVTTVEFRTSEGDAMSERFAMVLPGTNPADIGPAALDSVEPSSKPLILPNESLSNPAAADEMIKAITEALIPAEDGPLASPTPEEPLGLPALPEVPPP